MQHWTIQIFLFGRLFFHQERFLWLSWKIRTSTNDFFVKKTFGRWKILFRSQKFNWPKKSQLIEYSIQRSLFEYRWYGTTLTSETKYVELLYFLNYNGNFLITISISILNTIKNSLLFCLLTKTLFPQKCYYLNIAGITNHFAVFFIEKLLQFSQERFYDKEFFYATDLWRWDLSVDSWKKLSTWWQYLLKIPFRTLHWYKTFTA
jgi:hypothetical protein